MLVELDGQTLELVQGDITQQQVDAIVNAANRSLAGGGGVDGAIHRRGGPAIMEETDRRYPEGCATGSAVASGAGELSAKHVFHAVGPYYRGDDSDAELLGGAYRKCLELAVEHHCESIAFPAISTGVYRYPMEQAARVALSTTLEFMQTHEAPRHVRFVLFGADAFDTFTQVLRELTAA